MAYGQLKPFYVFNNGWSTKNTNLTAAGTKESITAFDTCTSGTISWKTDYDWSGANNTVKAYPAAILGWQDTKGWQVSSQTMLPKTISSIGSAKCSWAFSVTGGAAQNVSFDIWVHNTTCSQSAIPATGTAPSDEIMIWPYANGGVQPAGSKANQTVSVGGATWDLWEGNVSSWKVHSFVRQGNATSLQDLDILAFLKVSSLNLGSKCLSSIQAGTEVFQGTGTVNTSSYTCSVQ
jgi:xyloglucan-specific endo-beta-1,4-glucanase